MCIVHSAAKAPLHYQLGQALERLGNQDEALESNNQALYHRLVRD